jgi:tetratricopeptide (TPR) repeat protein
MRSGARGIVAGSALVLMAGLLLWLGRPRDEVVQRERQPLLVLPLRIAPDLPENAWLRQGLAEMIRLQLRQDSRLNLLPVLRAAEREEEPATAGAALETARRLGAGRVLVGSYEADAGRFVLRAEVLNVADQRAEASVSARGEQPGDLLEAVHTVGSGLLTGLEPALAQELGAPGGPLPRGPVRLGTRSLEASRLYLEALDGYARGGWDRIEEAEKRLDESLRLDPAFAQAYLKKAEIQQWRRSTGYGDPDPEPAIRDALQHSESLSDQDRLLLTSFEALVAHDTAAALARCNALMQFHPVFALESGVPALVLQTLQGQSRFELHVDSPYLPAPGRALVHYHLAQAWRRKGELPRAARHAEQAVELWPLKAGPRYLSLRAWLARVHVETGARERALEELRSASQAPEADTVSLTEIGWGFYMAGEAREARECVDRAVALDRRHGNARHLRGWLALARGDYDVAARELELAFHLTNPSYGSAHHGMIGLDVAALYYSGVAMRKAGREERATATLRLVVELCRRTLEDARADLSPAARWQAASYLARASARLSLPAPEPPGLEGDRATYFVQSARLHAVQGRSDQALKELEQGLGEGFGERQHIRDDPDFESLRKSGEWKRLVGMTSN